MLGVRPSPAHSQSQVWEACGNWPLLQVGRVWTERRFNGVSRELPWVWVTGETDIPSMEQTSVAGGIEERLTPVEKTEIFQCAEDYLAAVVRPR